MAKLIKFEGNRPQNEVENLANEVINHDWVVFVPRSKEADLVQHPQTVWRKDEGKWWPEEGPEDLSEIYLCDEDDFLTDCMIALRSDCTIYAVNGNLKELHHLLYGQENGETPLLPVPVWRTFRSRAGLEYYVHWFSTDEENQQEIDDYNDWCEKTYQRGW